MWATSTKTIAMMLIVYYDTDMEEEDAKEWKHTTNAKEQKKMNKMKLNL